MIARLGAGVVLALGGCGHGGTAAARAVEVPITRVEASPVVVDPGAVTALPPPPEGLRRMTRGECDIFERHVLSAQAPRMGNMTEEETVNELLAFTKRCQDICDTPMTDNEISCLLEQFDEVEVPRCRR